MTSACQQVSLDHLDRWPNHPACQRARWNTTWWYHRNISSQPLNIHRSLRNPLELHSESKFQNSLVSKSESNLVVPNHKASITVVDLKRNNWISFNDHHYVAHLLNGWCFSILLQVSCSPLDVTAATHQCCHRPLNLAGSRLLSSLSSLPLWSSGGDQSERINSSHSIIQEFAHSDWMGLSGGHQSGNINSSHPINEELARFARSDWMRLSGGNQSERINSSHSIIDHFSTCQNYFSTCQNSFPTCQNKFSTCQNNFSTCQKKISTCQINFSTCQNNFPTLTKSPTNRGGGQRIFF